MFNPQPAIEAMELNSPLRCECEKHAKGVTPGLEWMYHETKELPFVAHLPFECKCTNDLKRYRRGVFCSCCVMPGDTEIGE